MIRGMNVDLHRLEHAFVVGVNEYPYLGAGWHDRQIRGTDGVAYRAASEDGLFRLAVPKGATRLTVVLHAPVPFLGRPFDGEILVDGHSLGKIRLETDAWAVRHFDFPAGTTPRVLNGSLVSHTTFVPAKLFPHSTDQRRMGAHVSAMRVGGSDW